VLLKSLKNIKDLFEETEINSYFQRFFQNKRDKEIFLKKNFQKIVCPIKKQLFEKYCQYHPS
jgi:phage anti-repressor protein